MPFVSEKQREGVGDEVAMKKACMYCGHTNDLMRALINSGKWVCRNKKACEARTGGIGIKK